MLLDKITEFCKSREQEFGLISEERKLVLLSLSDYISKKFEKNETPKMTVICTHNSRRSHLGQLWLAVGAEYYGLPSVETFSGGTESTAFNIRAVNAMREIGFHITAYDAAATNPNYGIKWSTDISVYRAFSKKYETPPNPSENFAAIMVCTSADEACPIVAGCEFRLSLPFDDPKAFDDTDLEAEKYMERAEQIGREMLFVLSKIKK
ncbi:MAG: arsenate reductase [Saprospiraceae bacterium]|jgi:arsenate reductase